MIRHRMFSTWCPGLLAGLMLLATTSENLRGDDPPSKGATDPDAIPAGVADALEPLVKRSPAEVISQTVSKMETVRDRLSDSELKTDRVGKTTLDLQSEILANLDQLLNQQGEGTPPSEDESESDSPPQPNGDSERQPMENSEPDPQGSEQNSPGENPMGTEQETQPSGSGDGGQRRDGQADDSEERADEGTVQMTDLRRQRERLIRVWGHLPPKLRDRLLNMNREKYLPEYEDHIRRYYDALEREPVDE